jgi:hypothetical protein
MINYLGKNITLSIITYSRGASEPLKAPVLRRAVPQGTFL